MKASPSLLFSSVVVAVAALAYLFGLSHSQPPAPEAAPTPGTVAPAAPNPVPAIVAAAAPNWKRAAESRAHWEERVAAIRQMPDNLAPADIAALMAYLHEPPSRSKSDWYVVANEIMSVLRKRGLAPETYSRDMLGLLQDAQADPVIRDYAAQTLAQWIAGLDANLGREPDAIRAGQTFDAMLREAQQPANGGLTLVGTTLNALADAVLNGDETMQAKKPALAQAALAFADGIAAAAAVNRSAAIQVAARMEDPALPSLCRKLVADRDLASDVRLSAIAALGLVGQSSDRTLLEATGRDQRFHYAAQAALQRITPP